MINQILRRFFSNIPFLILSIILALTVWILAVMIRTHKINITVPIEFVNQPDKLVITNINTRKLNITLQGRGTDYVKFMLRLPRYELDLSMLKSGLNRVKLIPDELILTAPVLLKAITPEYVEITTDILTARKILVTVPYRIEPQKGTYITNIIVQDTVNLLGPEIDMKFLDELLTDSLFISDYSLPQVSRRLKVVVPDEKIFKTQPESVTVIASVEKEETRIYPDLKVKTVITPPRKIEITPDLATITLRGAENRIQLLADTLIKVIINPIKLEPGEYELPAEISLPKGIFLVKCEPKTFVVKIR